MPPPSSLAGAPAEVLLLIFQSCESLQQLNALSLTNRRMHAVWLEHQSIILWHVGPKMVPAFDRALMAVW
jgi:hypothetical protein